LIFSTLQSTRIHAAAIAHVQTSQARTIDCKEVSSAAYSIPSREEEEEAKPKKRKWHSTNGWRGIAALLLAAIAFFFLFVPWITWLPATLAVIIGTGGLLHRRRNKILAALGLAGGLYVLALWLIAVLPGLL